jgi:hypothetical protein
MEKLRGSQNIGLVDLYYNDVYALGIVIDQVMKDSESIEYKPNSTDQLSFEMYSSRKLVLTKPE